MQVLAVEVWRYSRVGVRTHINQELDPLAGNERRESLEVVVGVPDRPYDWS
jgi:hypothetical protein